MYLYTAALPPRLNPLTLYPLPSTLYPPPSTLHPLPNTAALPPRLKSMSALHELDKYDARTWERNIHTHSLQALQRLSHWLVMWAQVLCIPSYVEKVLSPNYIWTVQRCALPRTPSSRVSVCALTPHSPDPPDPTRSTRLRFPVSAPDALSASPRRLPRPTVSAQR